MESNVEKDSAQRKSLRAKLMQRKKLLILLIVVMVIVVGAVGVMATEKASDNPTFCTLCHNMQPYYASWHDSNLLANKHAQAGVKCHDCHESSISLQASEGIKYVTGNYQNPLVKREFATKEFCVRCHDFEKVKEKTNFAESNPHDSHNGELECMTCHSMHQPSQLLCKQCHTFSWMENLPDYWAK